MADNETPQKEHQDLEHQQQELFDELEREKIQAESALEEDRESPDKSDE